MDGVRYSASRDACDGSHSELDARRAYVLCYDRVFLRNTNSVSRIASVAFLGSVQFFLITNFFVWLGARDLYPLTAAGLLSCYIAAIPFFAWTVLGDLFYTGVLFTAYALYSRRLTAASASRA